MIGPFIHFKRLNTKKSSINTSHFCRFKKSPDSNTKSLEFVNGFYTNCFKCTQGVRQGDILSHFLFPIFIYDIVLEIKELNKWITRNWIWLYADDIWLLVENDYDM